jgi:hypothetical protein
VFDGTDSRRALDGPLRRADILVRRADGQECPSYAGSAEPHGALRQCRSKLENKEVLYAH